VNRLIIPDYNFHQTLLGGQAFNWEHSIVDGQEVFYGTTQDRLIKIVLEKDNEVFWQTYPKNDEYDFLKQYLRLDVDYKNILKKINKDEHINSAINHFPNLRLLSQDFDQTTLSFIISSFNSIKSIRTRINKMKRDLGEKVALDGQNHYLFPKTEVIADARVDLLTSHSLGYRAKYIKEAANLMLQGDLANKLVGLGEAETRAELLKLPGIGDKVADCIMVFSLNYDNLTPLDVWGKRVFTDLYRLDEQMKYQDVREWLNSYFDGYGAWAGQFLFEWYRSKDK
jgi:N-glycosylase/DNA lyase